jgi:hypothetical protein
LSLSSGIFIERSDFPKPAKLSTVVTSSGKAADCFIRQQSSQARCFAAALNQVKNKKSPAFGETFLDLEGLSVG